MVCKLGIIWVVDKSLIVFKAKELIAWLYDRRFLRLQAGGKDFLFERLKLGFFAWTLSFVVLSEKLIEILGIK